MEHREVSPGRQPFHVQHFGTNLQAWGRSTWNIWETNPRSNRSTWNIRVVEGFPLNAEAVVGLFYRQMGMAITVASQKGGVGKTTTVVNLSASFCLAGKKVLLLDVDPQGNASSGVGFHRSPLPAGSKAGLDRQAFLSWVMAGKNPESLIQEAAFEHMSVIPSSPELSELEIVKKIQDSALQRFRKQIRSLSQRFDYILIDCPPSLGGIPTIALAMSDAVLVPIQCEYYAMEGLSQILPVIRELQRTANPELKILGFLLTMYSDELELSRSLER